VTGPPGTFALLAAALVLDRVVGDPPWLWRRLPHPVTLFGWMIGRCDAALNDPALGFEARRRRGVAASVSLAAVALATGIAIELVTAALPLGFALEIVLVAVLLAQKSLIEHVGQVADGLRQTLAGGRAAVARIVGRDVTVLDEAGVARAAIESAAENFSDGLVAPAFWYATLGLPGLLVYKLANTADSMIGHRTPRHEAFGWAAARFDDALNFIPARLSAVLIALAAPLRGGQAGAAWKAALRDASLHRSPNAGWPEAAAAGALGLALGGPRRYGPVVVDGAWLNGSSRQDAGPEDIRAAMQLIDSAWLLLLALAAGFAALTFWLARGP
jgi:adenosylcobinamide-phosphate synthase